MRHKLGVRLISSKRKAPSNSSGQIWTVLSAVSQFTFASLAVFGYFYTIRPIYQNQFLSENKAKLEIEGNQLRLENRNLAESVEMSRKLIDRYDSQISILGSRLAELRSSYSGAVDEKRIVQKELDAAISVKQELDKKIQAAKASHVLESFLAYVSYRGISELTNYTTSLNLIDLPGESDLNNSIKLFLGDPYQDTKELLQTYFEGSASGYLAIGIEPDDPIKASIGKLFIDELDKIADEIAIPNNVFVACREIIVEYRAEIAEKEAARNNLNLKDYKTFEEYNKKGTQLLEDQFSLRDKTMKLLDDLKSKQYDTTAVFQLIVSRLKDRSQ